MADPEITANIGSLDPLPDGEFEATDLFEVERPRADPDPNYNYRATFAELTAAVAASLPPSDAAQTGDVLITARDPGAGWLELGRVYAQAAYPDLYSMVGLIGDEPAGAAWASYAPGPLPNAAVKDACWVTGKIAIAVGSNIIWRTTNGGASWSSIAVSGGLLCVVRVSDDVVLAAGGSGVIMRSTDAGASWTPVTSGTTSTIRTLTVFNASRIFAHADAEGHNKISNDGGATWSAGASTAASASYGSVRFSNSTAVVFPISGTKAYRTVDGGSSWTQIAIPSFSDVVGAASITPTTGVVVNFTGAGLRSTDAGLTWTAITTGASTVRAVEVSGEGFVVVVGNTPAYSSDYGATWTPVSATLTGVLTAFAIPGGEVIGVGNAVQYRSLPQYSYDSATQFKTPLIAGIGNGLKGYIKA